MNTNNMLNTLNWEITTEPVLTFSGQFTNKKAILRQDTGATLGIVGQDYAPVYNQQLMGIVDRLTHGGCFRLFGYDTFREGKLIIAYLEYMTKDHSMLGLPMREYLIIGNSHDGSRPLYAGTGCSLIRCENQFYSTLEIFRRKHTSRLNINDFELDEVILRYREKSKELYTSFEGLDQVRVTNKVVHQLIEEVQASMRNDSRLANPRENRTYSNSIERLRVSIAREMEALGENAFGLFNGVTWYTTHEMRENNTAFYRVDGAANRINQIAYSFCMALKE